MTGEQSYRIERKAEACSDNTLSFAPVETIYQHDDFATGLDLTAWVPKANVQTASTKSVPTVVSDASGTSSVSWQNGAIRLHDVANNVGNTGYNFAFIEPKNYAEIIGDKDFDIQVDFSLPNGTIAATQYFSYVRLDMYLPDTAGGQNNMYVGRMRDGVEFSVKINGVQESGGITTTAQSGTLRMVRSNRKMSGYFWDGSNWILLYQHSQPLTADLKPVWTGVVQHARRNEPGGQNITTDVDNFRFNTVGGLPVAKLDLAMNEASWNGTAGEMKDSAAGSNHGSALYSNWIPSVATDSQRGRVGYFSANKSISVPGSGSLQAATSGSFTFAGWIKASSATSNSVILGRPTAIPFKTALVYTTSKGYQFYVNNTTSTQTTVTDAGPYEPGAWHHVVGVADDVSKTITLYVDGQAKNSSTYSGTLYDHGTSAYSIGQYFTGNLDDVRIYDRALTAAQVKTVFDNSMTFKDTGLEAGATYCYRIYPMKSGSCSNWTNHASQIQTTIAANTLPTKPANVSPANGTSNIASLTPTLTATAFSDADSGDTHYASQWRVSTGSGAAFDANVFYDSGAATATNSHTMTSGLTFGASYFWKVRYQDNKGGWSDYSNETSFATVSNVAPNQPVNATPANSATGVARKPTLTASAFVDGDGGDAHQASQWQVSTGSGAAFDANKVYDSGTAAGTISHAVATTLTTNTVYYWKVRYQDSKGTWSAYAAESSFTTTNLLTGYHFNESSGNTTVDSSGNNAGTIINGGTNIFAAASFLGNGLNCDGNDRVSWSYAEGRLKNTFSLEAMVKTSVNHEVEAESTSTTGGTAGQKYVFGANFYNAPDAGMGVSVGMNGISVYEHSGGYMPPIAVYSGSLGTGWNHLIVTYTNKQPRIYLNGNLVRTGLASPRTNVYVTDSVCSDAAPYGYFTGAVDEVNIYSTALSAAEVRGRCEAMKGAGQCP